MPELIELFKIYGPTVAITIVFVWQAVIRERRMSARIDHLEDKLTGVLTTVIVQNTDAFHAFANACKRCQGPA